MARLRHPLIAILVLVTTSLAYAAGGNNGGSGGGGGGTPGGAAGDLQYDNAGSFGGVTAGALTDILVGGGALLPPIWTTSTGSGAPVRATSPSLVTPILGTPTSGTLTNATGLPLTTGITGTFAVGDLPVASSGSALSTIVDVATGSVLVSGGVAGLPAYSAHPTLSGLTVTAVVITGCANDVTKFLNGAGGCTAPAGSGTVTSVTGTAAEITSTGGTTPVLSLPTALTFTGKTVTGGTFASPTLTTPILGIPTSGTLTNATGLPLTTGITGSFAIGDLPVATSSSALSVIADVATGSVLVSGGIGVKPLYSSHPTLSGITTTGTGPSVFPQIVAPGGATSGNDNAYVDSVNKKWCVVDDAGLVSCTVVALANVATKFFSSLANGVITATQPAFTDLSGTATTGQTYAPALGGVCAIIVGAENGSALVDADIGPQSNQCFFPQASTVQEVLVIADGGTPNVMVSKKSVAAAHTALLTTVLATGASGVRKCSKTAAVTCIDATTTASATLQNNTIAIGETIGLASGIAGGTAKLLSVFIYFTKD